MIIVQYFNENFKVFEQNYCKNQKAATQGCVKGAGKVGSGGGVSTAQVTVVNELTFYSFHRKRSPFLKEEGFFGSLAEGAVTK